MKTFRLFTLFVLALMSFLLVGCAASSRTSSLIVSTTAIAESTETSIPPSTATAIKITATSMPKATKPTLKNTLIDATLTPMKRCGCKPCTCTAAYPNAYSPSKNWLVVTAHSTDREDGLTSKFVYKDGKKKWDISFKDFYIEPYRANDMNMTKLLEQAFIPVHWTKHEDYVYLAVPLAQDMPPYYASSSALFRLDLASGKLRPVLAPATAPGKSSYAFSFSAGTKLAYINTQVHTVKIVVDDTISGDEQTITLDARFTEGGSMAWSNNDEKQLALSAFDANTTGGGYSLIVYNLETNKNEYIIQQSDEAYLPISWIDDQTLYVLKGDNQWLYINTTTKAISEAPALVPAP